MQNIFPLQGTLMHYDWGGKDFIPKLLDLSNTSHQPFAEYWLGAHPKSSAQIIKGADRPTLKDAIQADSVHFLGKNLHERGEGLPFLLKVLDVASILSIQVHPTKEQAITGFDKEEAAGIPLDASFRNYKDRNHKPEMLVALSEFWLLHGFQTNEQILRQLEDVPEFNRLIGLYVKDGLSAVYRLVMEMSDEDAYHWLLPLVKRELRKKREGQLNRSEPGWWVTRLFNQEENIQKIDKALFSIYIMNIVCLQPMESLFQGAGQPHAYMEGQCVELMSNSDNVLRAGLTNKHIDVPELIRLTRFEPTLPQIIRGSKEQSYESIYRAPVEDFSIATLSLVPGSIYQHTATSPEILLIIAGSVCLDGQQNYKTGDALYVCPETTYELTATENATLFRAFVP